MEFMRFFSQLPLRSRNRKPPPISVSSPCSLSYSHPQLPWRVTTFLNFIVTISLNFKNIFIWITRFYSLVLANFYLDISLSLLNQQVLLLSFSFLTIYVWRTWGILFVVSHSLNFVIGILLVQLNMFLCPLLFVKIGSHIQWLIPTQLCFFCKDYKRCHIILSQDLWYQIFIIFWVDSHQLTMPGFTN